MGLIVRSIGSRLTFAVEFSVEPRLTNSAVEWWGCMCLWVAGDCVGNPAELELVSIGMASLVRSARQVSRTSSLLSNLPTDRALDAVKWAVYGEDNPELERLVGSADLGKFEVLGTSAGPSFDNWEAILIEEGEDERFLYRRSGEPAKEASWKSGTFREIVLQADAELRGLMRSTSTSGVAQ